MSWQTAISGLYEKLQYLKSTETLSDITLIVGKDPEKKVFLLHRLILSIFSETFEAMLYRPLTDDQILLIELPDDDPDAFEILINYMYTGEEEIENVQTTVEVCRLADKYMILQLKEKCICYLKENISIENVIGIYEMATDLMEHKLRMKCWLYIQENTNEVLESDNFINSSTSTVQSIILKDNISICTEVVIYDALQRWSKETCKRGGKEASTENVREIMDPFLPDVRFLTMTVEEFLIGPGKEKLLTSAEQVSIIRSITFPELDEIPKVGNESRTKRSFSYPEFGILIETDKVTSTNTFPTIQQQSEAFIMDTYIYGVKFYLSETSEGFTLPVSFRCTLTIRNISKNMVISKTFEEFTEEGEHCWLVMDEILYVAKGEKCEITLEGEYFKQQELYVCNGTCKMSEFISNDFHFHNIVSCRI